ncbi:MAG TPA: DUF1552 domain-containing protein [Polyangia bacterium]
MKSQILTRRQILRGTGVALALPWMETFAPRTARAQAATAKKRFVALYFPNGTAAFWKPTGNGSGENWKLSPILEPFAPIKQHVAVLGNISNYSPFGGHAEPSHSNCGASTWTCVKPTAGNNSISIDQVIANGLAGKTPLHSLQVGLSTLDSSPDGLPPQHSRSMSWKSPTEPLYKIVNPQAAFDRLMAGGTVGGPNTNLPTDPSAMRRRALNKSALDFIRGSASDLQKRLSSSDVKKLDQFLTSVRELEGRVGAPEMQVGMPVSCQAPARPSDAYAVGNVPAGYSRQVHADLMNDLVAVALQCDITRSVNFMLDDARSDFVYNFLKERTFTAAGSTPGNANVGSYHGLQHAGETNNGFATIGHWMVAQTTKLAQKLMAVQEGAAGSILDNTVMVLASGMKGGNHDSRDIPIAIVGSGGKVLKTDIFHNFPSDMRLVDVHKTYLERVFGITAPFGTPAGTLMPALLA